MADDTTRLRAVLESAQCNIYSSRQLFKLAQDAYKRAVPPLNSGAPRCRPLLDAALELGLQVLSYVTVCSFIKEKRKRTCIAVNGTPSHSCGASLAIWDHTVLPATRHK